MIAYYSHQVISLSLYIYGIYSIYIILFWITVVEYYVVV